MRKIGGYFKGVFREMKRVKWPDKDRFLPAVSVVLCITIFAAIFLSLEDYAGSTLVGWLKDAFSSIVK